MKAAKRIIVNCFTGEAVHAALTMVVGASASEYYIVYRCHMYSARQTYFVSLGRRDALQVMG